MRKYLQLILLIILISISFIYYKKYFYKDELVKNSITKNKDEISDEKQNNLIKNLKYEVKFDNNTEYTVLAELSEQVNENGNEFIKMETVSGIFTNEKNVQLIIKSNNAVYNNLNYNTNFSNNVNIYFLANTMTGIAWAFVIPYILGLCATFDSHGQMAALAGFISKIGLASGPLVGSLLIIDYGFNLIINIATITEGHFQDATSNTMVMRCQELD